MQCESSMALARLAVSRAPWRCAGLPAQQHSEGDGSLGAGRACADHHRGRQARRRISRSAARFAGGLPLPTIAAAWRLRSAESDAPHRNTPSSGLIPGRVSGCPIVSSPRGAARPLSHAAAGAAKCERQAVLQHEVAPGAGGLMGGQPHASRPTLSQRAAEMCSAGCRDGARCAASAACPALSLPGPAVSGVCGQMMMALTAAAAHRPPRGMWRGCCRPAAHVRALHTRSR
jgi:hypothetical protein